MTNLNSKYEFPLYLEEVRVISFSSAADFLCLTSLRVNNAKLILKYSSILCIQGVTNSMH